MPEDEPTLLEIVHGVADRMTPTDAGVVLLISLAGTIYALYQGLENWWIYTLILVGLILLFEALQWYYFDHPIQRLQEKTERLADGEDIEPDLDRGTSLTDPYTASILGGILIWGLISIHVLRPVIGKYPGLYVFCGGTLVIIAGVSLVFKKIGRID
ncbi:hypothetical protein [Halobacterium sp. R2-5]|uniref:hypothetical protein n=1 Tax=Halobacterium sp. R2-5 TaxID=2715751 RepID=UPI00142478E1|nr:hypothetical protein [Halobacterium sp. R2-5]NIC00224.1 hypothetical protein [Halobacterium sp. R2-5]